MQQAKRFSIFYKDLCERAGRRIKK